VCADLHAEGKFKQLGLSNYPAWQVVEIWHLCEKRGWPTPTVYQGMYNGLTRSVESELFPALRELKMRFYVFNPLAGGMLTGKHTNFENNPSPGRFARLKSYRNRYWKASYFEAVGALTAVCQEKGIAPAEAAYRWLGWHSLLSGAEGDGVLIGASGMSQLEGNLTALSQGALPKQIVDAFDNAWEEARCDCPPYFNAYTSL
jgi:aflatoxin B1 aldehyde reductase